MHSIVALSAHKGIQFEVHFAEGVLRAAVDGEVGAHSLQDLHREKVHCNGRPSK